MPLPIQRLQGRIRIPAPGRPGQVLSVLKVDFGGMKTSSRLPGRAAVVGLESGPKSPLQTAPPAWGLLRAGDLPLLNAFKGAILASKPASAR